MSVTATPAWQALARHSEVMHAASLSSHILEDNARLKDFELKLNGLRFNYAFQNVTHDTVALLTKLAEQQKIADWRSRMFAGDRINTTEQRAVLHTALRCTDDKVLSVDGVDIRPEISATQKRIAAFVHNVRSGKWRGATGKPIRFVVNIGIGGSDLGPRMATLALHSFVSGVEPHFVANIDAFELENVLRQVDAEQTLFVVVSKTFTTHETLLNAQSARRWLVEKLGEAAVEKHFVAVSVNGKEVEKFGIHADNMFPMWDWVGGRFSLWSAVGLTLQISIGNEAFRDLLAGADAMDTHFQTASLVANIPVMMALFGIWNRNFQNMPALVVLPYSERLREMPRYLQQLELESNGKSVTRDGDPITYDTAPALFGECGTVGQHSFHQWLHQGSTPIPADFIGIVQDDFQRPDHQRALLSNLAAQMGALAFGQSEVTNPHDVYPGGRPSNLILLDRLDPYHLGMLLALYEHKVFVQGVIWEINSFDQPGVELGKRMAKNLEKTVQATTPPNTVAGVLDAFFKNIAS